MIVIEYIGGNCPVQIEGTINGHPFYFRARGSHWSMGIGGDPLCKPDWYRVQKWGDGPYDAGWMEEAVAVNFVNECANDFLHGKPGGCE